MLRLLSGLNAPICTQTRIIYAPDVTAYEALIIATYRSPPGLQELYEMLRPGRGRLTINVSVAGQRTVTRDVETGAPVEGPGRPGEYWQVVKGSNVVDRYQTVLRLETAYPAKDFRLARVLALEGRVNDRPFELMTFGTMQAESCKCLGVETIQPLTTYDPFVQVRYLLQWSGPDRTWNEVKSQRGEWIVKRFVKFADDPINPNPRGPQPVEDEDQNLVFRDAEAFVPGRVARVRQPLPPPLPGQGPAFIADWVPVPPERRRIYELADFSILQGIKRGLRKSPWPRSQWSMYAGLVGNWPL